MVVGGGSAASESWLPGGVLSSHGSSTPACRSARGVGGTGSPMQQRGRAPLFSLTWNKGGAGRSCYAAVPRMQGGGKSKGNLREKLKSRVDGSASLMKIRFQMFDPEHIIKSLLQMIFSNHLTLQKVQN